KVTMVRINDISKIQIVAHIDQVKTTPVYVVLRPAMLFNNSNDDLSQEGHTSEYLLEYAIQTRSSPRIPYSSTSHENTSRSFTKLRSRVIDLKTPLSKRKTRLRTPYEIFRERIPDISYFHVFGCPVFIHNHKDHLGKFDSKADDRWSKDKYIELVIIIGDLGEGMLTRSIAAKLTAASASECLFVDFLSEIEPKRVFRNKKDEHEIVTKNKARLVAQGYSQEERIDYDETFAPVARIEAIMIFLAFAAYMNFIVFQMDVKSVFLNDQVPERESTLGACQILSEKLVCWSAKKQQSVAMSSAEAEYVAAGVLCKYLINEKLTYGNYSSTEQVNYSASFCLLSPHWDKVLLGSDYTQDESFGSSPTNLSNSYFSKDPSKVTPSELTDFMVVANKREHSVNPLPFSVKKKKCKSQTVTPTLPSSQGPKAPGSLPQKRKKPKSKKTPTETMRNIQLTSTGFPSTLDDGTRKSKHFPEGTNIDPRDSGGNVQPADRGLPFMAFDKGAVKTMSFPEGPRGEKDSEGLKPPADIEPQTNHVADPLGTGAKYQVDETQYTRLRYQSLTENKEAVISYADLMASIEGYYKEIVDHKEQIDKVIDAAINSLDKNSIAKGDILNALNRITETLKTIQDAIKDDLVHNKKAFKGQSSAPSSNMPQTTLVITKRLLNVRGENVTQTDNKEPPFYTEREHVSMEDDAKKPKLDKAEKEPTKVVPISVVRPITRPNPEVIMIESLSRPPLTDPTLEIHVPQRKGNGIATNEQLKSTKKLVPTSKVVREDPDEPIRVAHEEAEKIRLDPKMIMSAKAGEKFKKARDTEHQVLKKEHSQKAKRAMKLKKRFEQYMWTTSCRIRPEPITDFKIHPNTKPVVLDVYKANDKRNFQKIPEELRMQSALPALVPKQAPSESSRRKRKHMKLEPKIKIPGLECNRSLLKGVPFVNNMVIEEPEYGIFFTDVFGDQAFQIWNDTHKVGVDSLVSYLVMASMVKTLENAKFGLKLKKLIVEHHDQEKLK
nr:retrovirus-related Pol polyprotein from transposon TNT 1-94 [Tanacetum cinerariifolium]